MMNCIRHWTLKRDRRNYRLVRWVRLQQVRPVKDRNVLTGEEVMGRWKEYFDELMKRMKVERRVEVIKTGDGCEKDERMKADGPDDTSVGKEMSRRGGSKILT